MRFRRLTICTGTVAVLVSASAGVDDPAAYHPRLRELCDAASGEGTAAGQGEARWLAEAGLRQQIDDVRGAILIAGYKHVRPMPADVRCRPYVLGGDLTQCRVTRCFCGR